MCPVGRIVGLGGEGASGAHGDVAQRGLPRAVGLQEQGTLHGSRNPLARYADVDGRNIGQAQRVHGYLGRAPAARFMGTARRCGDNADHNSNPCSFHRVPQHCPRC